MSDEKSVIDTEAEIEAEIRTELNADATASTPIPHPRIRWGAITWGLIVSVIAAATLSLASATESRANVADFLGDLTFGSASLILVLVLGVTVLLLGLLAVIRRAQRSN